MSVVAIIASQGAGKTVLLTELASRGFNVVQRKTSRSILQDWGVTLTEVNHNPSLTVEFQEEILKRKLEDDFCGSTDTNVIFTERSPIDLFVYAVVALGSNNQYSDWLNDYYQRCQEAQHAYRATLMLPGGRFPVAFDGVRGSNPHYSELVDMYMLHIYRKMVPRGQFIEGSSISERADSVLSILRLPNPRLPS